MTNPPDPTDVMDALRVAQTRGLLPTTLGTAELRELGAELLARSVFSARASNVVFLTKLKEVTDAIAAGTMDEATARVTLLETLKTLGYTPEGGFPDAPPGEVPPAVRGSLQDLSSFRRLDLIVRTQADLMRGRGQQMRGHSPERLREFPAWELVRIEDREVPRDWLARWRIAGGLIYDDVTPELGTDGQVRATGRMIAMKGSEVWGELGSAGNFSDALSVDHPPFAFSSGMGWSEVSRAEVIALGILGPDGETLEEWESGPRPRVIAGPLPLPSPSVSTRGMDEELVKELREDLETDETAPADAPGKHADPKTQTPGRLDFSDLMVRAMARRMAAREQANEGGTGQ